MENETVVYAFYFHPRLHISKSNDTVGSSMNPTLGDRFETRSDGAGIISFIHSLLQFLPLAFPFRCIPIFSYLCLVVALFGTAMAFRTDLVGGGALIVISTVFFELAK